MTDDIWAFAANEHGIAAKIGEDLCLFDTKGELLARAKSAGLSALALHDDGIMGLSNNGTIDLYDRALERQARLELPAKGVSGIAWDGRRIALASDDGHVRVWNAKGKKLMADVRGRQEAMNAVVFLHDGRIAAVGRDTAKGPPIYVWKT